jgi:hypothetical protein
MVEYRVRQIIYFSTAAEAQDATNVADIVAVSYRRNSSAGITGMLVAGGHRYFQLFEGDPAAVEATLARIRHDRRHVGVTELVDRHVARRSFADWTVAFDGEPEFGNFSTLEQMVAVMRRQVRDRALRSQIDCFERLFVLKPLPAAPSPWTLASSYRERSALDGVH